MCKIMKSYQELISNAFFSDFIPNAKVGTLLSILFESKLFKNNMLIKDVLSIVKEVYEASID